MLIISEEQVKFLKSNHNIKIIFSPIEKKPNFDYDWKTDDDVIVGYDVRKPYKITDDLGGECSGYINTENTAHIVHINSGELQQRGFFTNVVKNLKNNGVTHIRVLLQSKDSRIALTRLLQKEILKNPTELRGISVDLHPTKFEIT